LTESYCHTVDVVSYKSINIYKLLKLSQVIRDLTSALQ